ncbi:N-acetylmuramoyl-L-alanine amidase (plasmid) [Haloimpatiens sp. FM7330]|uniref:N-acetylmuramoyl-L-alanine amidase n=1 Tax=Haloimpatiens sp. FM7330 TaxID=3298610 RepID=UPI0036425C08
MKIAVDFGHGVEKDRGASGHLNEEKVIREYGPLVIEKLRTLGHTVYNVTPKTASTLSESLSKRCEKANSLNVDLFISCHVNAFNENSHGCEVLYVSQKGKIYAQKIVDKISELGFTNRGAKRRMDLYVLKHTLAPAVLIEPFFCTCKSDCDLYNAEKLANAIVKGIIGEKLSTPKANYKVIKQNKSNRNLSLKALQHLFNIQGFRDMNGRSLLEDGVYGRRTQEAANKCLIRQGARGDITKWVQNRLIFVGYDKSKGYFEKYGADGVYGSEMKKAVMDFQKNRGLICDGIIGKNTWRALLY